MHYTQEVFVQSIETIRKYDKHFSINEVFKN